MRWINFSVDGGPSAYGILDTDDRIHEVHGTIFEPGERSGAVHRLADVKIEVPFIPRTFYAAGLNYVKHIREYAELTGQPVSEPKQADIGYRAVNALIAHDEAIVIPPGATQVEYEGELVVVIGKKAKHLSEAEALSCVLGYTIGNDVSERLWQASDRTFWRSKNADTFKPMGPWIETEFNIDAAETTVRLNGNVQTHFRTADMLFDIRTFISRMTQCLTLFPGDVIWMGTDGKSPKLKAGDVVEVEISGLGRLRNHLVN
ncbi:fumarylacetoacetate hydrolase family protein [Variovorax sp. LG9.2]|uniref:fumarylacetoacetate hydrolase family protein n=1 Tax=Variovorax sp. LG9.2 TaxID=3048626 RepID=UPI002B22E9B3|nr:fumarylacetoacetate hydrolase family protein [Variovorax sp. LG9.2]MEB0056586.1 fumarylacetoacetate hydrolase family protein [Variovorax sp. LG9.2]